jgi:UDP-N-acetylmuramyl tripeptide synthase
LSDQKTVILVSGTNGKTTTTALVVAGWGGAITNDTGANMPAGHVAALAGQRGHKVVLEVDEAWLANAIANAVPAVVVLLNLSRDQLDRANEVRRTSERWRSALRGPGNARRVVVANANDPLVVYAASEATNVRWCDVPTPWQGDAQSCPVCTRSIRFSEDSWSCECGFAKPTVITTTLGETLRVNGHDVALDLALPGVFNASNAAMALTALDVLDVNSDDAVRAMNNVRGVAGRFTLRRWKSVTINMLLAKNPSGFEALLSTVSPATSDVWIAINAQIADGKDPSWLYDVEFEKLRGHCVWCLGERRLDLATRLEYAGVDFRVVDDERQLLDLQGTQTLFANYTAFREWMTRTTPC